MSIINTWSGEHISINAKAIVGYAGILVNDQRIDILDLLRAYLEKGAEESCGQCFPCRNGLKKITKRLNNLCEGISSPDDLDFLKNQAKNIMAGARCDLGQTTPKPLLDVLEKAPHLLTAKKVKRGQYTSLVSAPCINACPAHVQIPSYIEKIRIGEFASGLECVMGKCIMPGTIGRVCERPCEKACKRGQNGQAIAIRHLKRYLFDRSMDYEAQNIEQSDENTRNVAIIGAGPAGLSCAYFLAKNNYKVTIYERQNQAGGMAKYGIPDYRLPAPVLAEEVARIKSLGVEINYNVDVGKDITINQLEQEYQAIFISIGAHKAPKLGCVGEDEVCTGLVSGMDYLYQAAKGNKIIHGKKILVIGGGNVAMDCVRTALRHGFEDVQLIYRRTEQEMPADPTEVHEAKLEGVKFNFLTAPKKIIHKNGQTTGLYCQKMQLGEPDATGRRSPIALNDEDFLLECDVIIHAIGQKVDINPLVDELSIENDKLIDKNNTFKAHNITGSLHPMPHIFAGGDCVSGPNTLISALAAGERAAKYIIEKLSGRNIEPSLEHELEEALAKVLIVGEKEAKPPVDYTKAMPIHFLPLSERLNGFLEVEKSSSEYEARLEASRCLRCWRIFTIDQ